MRIGIDARLYQKGLGIGRYIEQLLLQYDTMVSPEDTLFVFLTSEAAQRFRPKNPRIILVTTDIPHYSFAEQIVFSLILLQYHLDLVHFPHFNIPLLYCRPFVVTIHDCILLKHPESATSAASTRFPVLHWVRYQGYRIALYNATHRARRIITISEGVKKDIQTLLHIPQERIVVQYEGVIPCSPRTTTTEAEEKYLLYVGNAYPHKNLTLLLDMMENLRTKIPDIHLYCVGQEDFFMKKFCDEIVKRKLSDRVTHRGNVSDTELCTLYENAFAFVFPSLEEGFGLPPLEAMRSGCPVIASNASVMPEILGDAPRYFSPHNVHELLEKVIDLWENKAVRDTCIQKGIIQARRYTWEACARETYALYHII